MMPILLPQESQSSSDIPIHPHRQRRLNNRREQRTMIPGQLMNLTLPLRLIPHLRIQPAIQEEATRLPNRRRQNPKILAALQSRDFRSVPMLADLEMARKGPFKGGSDFAVVEE
jgi:hypothetical protein